MSKQIRILALMYLMICFVGNSQAQIVTVGDGSYTTSYPGADAAGRNGYPSGSPQLSGNASGKPVPTNDWWSKLVLLDHADNLFNYPMAMRTLNGGLMVTYIPQGVIDDIQPIIVGVTGLNESKATVSDYSDWTVTMDWGGRFNATSGIGMPFIYFEKGTGDVASVTINSGTAVVTNEMITVTDARNGGDFAIYAPTGSIWAKSGNTYSSSLNGQNYWSMAMLPQSTTDVMSAAVSMKKYAYVFPTNTTVTWVYDESQSIMRSDFLVETNVKEGSNTNVLMGLLPHQWRHLASNSATPQGDTFNSIRGTIKTLDGNSFSTEHSYHGILPTLPYLSNYSQGFNLSALSSKVKLLENDLLATWTDSYNEGQVMNRLIQTARIADEMGMTEARDKMISTIKERLEDWLTAEIGEVAFIFYYNSAWSALLGYPAGHGQDNNINDHHFHWGYFIHAAAFMEQFEPGWAASWGPMVDLLVRDAASPDRSDNLFPFLRNFNPYAGHCWANGFASFPQGNDQESTSESMQFNSSLIHWGTITGNDQIRDLGIYLYTTEQAAVEEYWFDIHEETFPNNQYSLVSRVWGNSYDNGTFWTSDIEASYGIELYPIHGGSMYLGHNINYAEKLWAEIEGNTGILSNDDNVNLWHDTMWKYLSFTDPQKAINLYNLYPDRNLKFGISDAQTYYWLHSMNAIGKVDASISADYPIAVAFNKGGEMTYAAHNYSGVAMDVTFSDGFVLNVPARSMATNKDASISGTITSSFANAYPGGSVDLEVTPEGGVPAKVEFYDNGTLLGEDTSAPYEWKAGQLGARVHGFYAKVFDGEAFGVTNIVSVVVGEQLPYGDASHAIPGTIEAGHYDYYAGGSGQGIAYADASPNNEGDFRMDEAVDAASSVAEGEYIGWISGGEWVEYTVDVATSGVYDLSIRFASGNQSGGGPFHLEINDVTITDDIYLTYTGDWDNWSGLNVTGVEIPKGSHVLKLAFDHGEFNIGRIQFTNTGPLSYGHPLANAGNNVSVMLPASTASLNGTGSSDADNDPLTYEWMQIYGPSIAAISDPSVVSPTISNLVGGIYKFQLKVSDAGHFDTDEVLVIVSATGNSSPNASILSPINNASFREGDDILITAGASDLEGSITKMEFYEGTNKLGEDLIAPYEWNWTNVPKGSYSLTVVATDNEGATGTSEAVSVNVSEVKSCEETSNVAQQGTFSVGYKATFESVGTNVTVTFELLDTDKVGVVAFLWQQNPFSEVQMDHVSGNTFRKTLTNLTSGQTLSLACKFAFAGGLSATKYIQYTVGQSCSGAGDTAAPTDFAAILGNVKHNSVELLLTASDDSGTVIYKATYGSASKNITGQSGSQQSLVITGLDQETAYTFSVAASDQAGNQAVNNPQILTATTLANQSNACSGNASEAQQGSFDVGYNYSFETSGTSVTMTFELLDDKQGVVAYLWKESPFGETPMTNVSGKKFTATLSGQTVGSTISYACKFAFAGGLAVTKYFQYVVGDDCSGSSDTSVPSNFTVSLGEVTISSIELLLYAEDDSGEVTFHVSDGSTTETISGFSGVEKTYVADQLTADTDYIFTVSAKDNAGNMAINNPITISAKTGKEPVTILGLDQDVSIYPNPVRTYLTVDAEQVIEAAVVTLSGKILLKTTDRRISFKNIPNGMYLLYITDQSGKKRTIQILKE